MNLVLGTAEETRLVPEDGRREKRSFDMLFVRGDSIILAAPPSRFSR